jgi:hypothetical protein
MIQLKTWINQIKPRKILNYNMLTICFFNKNNIILFYKK